MRTSEETEIKRVNRFATECLIVCLVWLIHGAAVSARESLESVLEKSNAVMNAPVQYCMASGDVETIVSVKRLPDGVTASRTEVNSPSLRMTTIMLGDGSESYEIYPDFGVLIDTRYRTQDAERQIRAVLDVIGNQTSRLSEILGEAKYGGHDCFVVEMRLQPEMLSAVGAVLNNELQDSQLPAIQRVFIDRKTYVLRGTVLLSTSRMVIGETECRDVVVDADLSDELFLPPNGFKVRIARSRKEHLQIVQEIIRANVSAAGREAVEEMRALMKEDPATDIVLSDRSDLEEIKIEAQKMASVGERARVLRTLDADPGSQFAWLLGLNLCVALIVAVGMSRWRRRRRNPVVWRK